MPEDTFLDIRKKIAGIIKLKGPSLPVHISRQTGINSLFAGALLSELANENIIKISHMKVGGSPLYFLQGQESSLENFHIYLPGKEKEAFSLLKKNKILQDNKQEPAIRVALRNLKDFAFSFLKDNEVFWRFYSVTEQEVRGILEPKEKEIVVVEKRIEEPEKIIKTEVIEETIEIKKKKPVKKKIKKDIREDFKKIKEKPKQEKQLEIGLKKLEKPEISEKIKKIRIKKPKQKSYFVLSVIDFLRKQNIEILEEKDIKKKEFSAKVRVDSALGKIKLLCIAKDKKRITENDLRLILQKAQAIKLPALVVFPGELDKKAMLYSESWSSLLKLKKLE